MDLTYLTCSTAFDRKQTCEYKGRDGYHAKVEVRNVSLGPKNKEYPGGHPGTEDYGWRRHECACCNQVLQWDQVEYVVYDDDYEDDSEDDYDPTCE